MRRYIAAAAASLLLLALPARALEILSEAEKLERREAAKRAAPPALTCTPRTLAATAKRGETAELIMTVKNSGGSALRWSIGKLPRWIVSATSSGELKYQEEKKIVLHVRTGSIAGDYGSAKIVVQAPGATGSPVTIPVSVELEPEDEPEVTPPDVTPPDVTPPENQPGLEVPDVPAPEPDGAGSSGTGIALRVGYMLPATASISDYTSTPFFGLQYRLLGSVSSGFSLELGLDMASTDADSEEASSTLTTGRADLLFHMGGGKWYLLSGFGGLFEESDVSGSQMAGLLDLGAGMALGRSKLDLRLTHGVLLGGSNVSGMTLLSTAYNF